MEKYSETLQTLIQNFDFFAIKYSENESEDNSDYNYAISALNAIKTKNYSEIVKLIENNVLDG